MRRKLLFLLFFCIATIAKAENEPVITLNVEVNEQRSHLALKSVLQILNFLLIGEMEYW